MIKCTRMIGERTFQTSKWFVFLPHPLCIIYSSVFCMVYLATGVGRIIMLLLINNYAKWL